MTERGNKGYELHKSEANTFKLSFFGSILLFCNPLWLLISLALTLGISCYWYTENVGAEKMIFLPPLEVVLTELIIKLTGDRLTGENNSI